MIKFRLPNTRTIQSIHNPIIMDDYPSLGASCKPRTTQLGLHVLFQALHFGELYMTRHGFKVITTYVIAKHLPPHIEENHLMDFLMCLFIQHTW
ncbi:unnamed protein product [Amoebophrya sp. A25]|nr:unnamed protein product [Amoebophrya sp. A25]|eukprot:GSA25T00013047001.1